MAEKSGYLGGETFHIITLLNRVYDLNQVRVRSVETLTECDHRPGQNVRSLHSDGNGKTHVSVADHVARAPADARAAHNIHRYIKRLKYR